jgi:hypothetical protein
LEDFHKRGDDILVVQYMRHILRDRRYLSVAQGWLAKVINVARIAEKCCVLANSELETEDAVSSISRLCEMPGVEGWATGCIAADLDSIVGRLMTAAGAYIQVCA